MDASGIVITPAHSTDLVPTARALFVEYATSLGFSLCFQGFKEELATLPGRYAPPLGRLYLAVDGGEAVGCAAMRPLEEGVCEMKRMYVRPPHRARGIGRALAARLVEDARGVGYRTMRLDTGPEMLAAQSLYRSLGFVEITRYNNDHMEGTLWMELTL